MTKQEWQTLHGIDDEITDIISYFLKNGCERSTNIFDIPWSGWIELRRKK